MFGVRLSHLAKTGVGIAVGLAVSGWGCPVAMAYADGSGPQPSAGVVSVVGSWVTTGPSARNISVQVQQKQTSSGMFAFLLVNESFCDKGSNQKVFLTFYVESNGNNGDFVIQKDLSRVRVVVPSLNLSGTETRLDNCADPVGIPQPKSIGNFTASLRGVWTATGPLTVRQPGRLYRDATATSTIDSSGFLDLGNLGPAGYAEIDLN